MTIVALRLKEEMEAAIQRILDRNIAFKNATESYLKSDPVAAGKREKENRGRATDEARKRGRGRGRKYCSIFITCFD